MLDLAPDKNNPSGIAGRKPATTMPPSTPMLLPLRSSSVKESARISLMGISLNTSILVFARTADESCVAPSPAIPLSHVSTRVTELYDRGTLKSSPWSQALMCLACKLAPAILSLINAFA